MNEKDREILEHLAQGIDTPTLLGKASNRDKSNISRSLKRFIKSGLVAQNALTKRYALTSSGRQFCLSLRGNKEVTTMLSKGVGNDNESDNEKIKLPKKRGHNIRVKYWIREAPKGWKESPKQFFAEQYITHLPLMLKNVDGVQFTIDNVHVKASARSLMIIPKELYAEDASHLMPLFIDFCIHFQRKLEKRFMGLRLESMPTILLGEVAHEGELIARIKDKYTIIKHTDNKIRVIIDKSRGVELEFIHPGLFDQDSETWERRTLQLLNSPYDYDVMGVKLEQEELRNDEQDHKMKNLQDVIYSMAQNAQLYNENIGSHVEAIKTLGVKVGELVDLVKEMKK